MVSIYDLKAHAIEHGAAIPLNAPDSFVRETVAICPVCHKSMVWLDEKRKEIQELASSAIDYVARCKGFHDRCRKSY